MEVSTTTSPRSSDVLTLGWFDILILLVVSISISSLLLLVFNRFDSIYALISGLFLTLVFLRIFSNKIILKPERFDIYLAIILIVGLFFMVKPYLYVMGGQDQGVYVSMSATYERTGSTFIKDNLREKLDGIARIEYDDYNFNHKVVIRAGQNEGSHLPGIYVKNLNESQYVYQFYPLHPIWMAIFSKILSPDNRVYSLVFFALISLFSFYLLAYELSGREKIAGYLIALFLAVNPLFVFFSKFPVSEMLQIAFSLAGFYYLVRYYNDSKKEQANAFFLWLSSLCFLCLFFVHIAGFLYMPIFYLILILTLLYIENSSARQHIIIYCFSVFSGYALSVIYGLFYSEPYSMDIYRIELSRLLVINPAVEIPLAIIVATGVPFLIMRWKNEIKQGIARILPSVFNALVILLLVFIPWNIYHVGKSDVSFDQSPVYIAMMYMSPFGTLLFLLSLNQIRKWREASYFIFLIFLVLVWVIKAVGTVHIDYQFYFARYLLSEIVVYSLLLSALGTVYWLRGTAVKKWTAYFLIVGLCAYSFYFTAYQLQGQEADGANQALKRVAQYLDDKDLLLTANINHTEFTPLKYYFGLPTFAFNPRSLQDEDFVNNLLDNFNDVFVLSTKPLYDANIELEDIIDYKEGIFEHTVHEIPTKFSYHNNLTYYMYKISRDDYFITNKVISLANYSLTNFYADSYWTNGEGIISGLKLPLHPRNRYLILKTGGHNPIRADLNKLNLKLFVNNQELRFEKMVDNDYYFNVDHSVNEINEIKIVSATFVPSELGVNDDSRPLGMDVMSILVQ